MGISSKRHGIDDFQGKQCELASRTPERHRSRHDWLLTSDYWPLLLSYESTRPSFRRMTFCA